MIKKNSISVLGHHNTHTPLHSNHGIDSHTIRDSMQYYRVWIYSCNSVLGVTSAIFTVVAAFVLADVRLSLLRCVVELYHPTFLYAYTALILQCGVVQVIGCLGAQRLNHKLLSVYWVLLLLLTIGDVVVGLVWVFKLDTVKLDLRPSLTHEFMTRYSSDPGFTQVWNRYQAQEHCCGVNGPLDFNRFSPDLRGHIFSGSGGYGGQLHSSETSTGGIPFLNLPESCCTMRLDYLAPFPVPIPLATQNTGKTSKRDMSKIQSSESLTSNWAPPPLALFLSRNFSGEDLSSSIPSLVGANKVRHYVHQWKKYPSWVPGSNGTSPNGTHPNDTFPDHLGFNTTLPHLGDPSPAQPPPLPTEEPEVTEITIPFTCRSPEKHFLPPTSHASTLPITRVYRRESGLTEESDDEDRLDSGSGSWSPSSFPDNEDIDWMDKKERKSPKVRHVVEGSGNNKYQHPSGGLPKSKIRVYRNGCVLKLIQWLDHVSGILFILGFCIIGFIKVCFLIILRYEIREMIEKIHVLELDAKSALTSPARSRGGSLGGNMLLKQYSTQSGGTSTTTTAQPVPPFTGITIKSPQGDTSNYCNSPVNNHISSQHYLHHHQHYAGRGGRRQSARSLGEGIRSTSHSQETVNLTLLITGSSGGDSGHCGIGSDCANNNKIHDVDETISLKVPTPEEREAKRSNFANYCTWESNVSADSSASGAYCSSYDHCCCPAETGSTACTHHAQHLPSLNGRTQVVHVEMENCSSTYPNSSFEDRSSQGSGRREDTLDELPEPVPEELPSPPCTRPDSIISISSPNLPEPAEGPEVNWLGTKPYNENETGSITRMPLQLQRRNGNNNSTNSSIDLDSDFVMALIGTAV